MVDNKNTYNKRAFSIKEVAEYACVSRATVENWLIRGILSFEELPSRGKGAYCFRRIRKNDLDEFLNKYYQQNSFSDKPNENKEFREMILLPRNS